MHFLSPLMGLVHFIGSNMTKQQQISRTQSPTLESLRPKTYPLAFAAIIIVGTAPRYCGCADPLPVALLAHHRIQPRQRLRRRCQRQ